MNNEGPWINDNQGGDGYTANVKEWLNPVLGKSLLLGTDLHSSTN